MAAFKYFLSNKVESPEGHEFYVRTMDTCRYFYPFWHALDYKTKHPPESMAEPLHRIEPFHSFVFRAFDEDNPIICIGNENKADAIRAHRNLYILIKKGDLIGP
jgi:hypothetical protein